MKVHAYSFQSEYWDSVFRRWKEEREFKAEVLSGTQPPKKKEKKETLEQATAKQEPGMQLCGKALLT